MDVLTRLFGTPTAFRRWAVASLVANMVLVVTGAIVRLTGSGLGCPTWPTCKDDAYVPEAALGIHGLIEFGNRLLTFVLIIIAVATLVAAFRSGADRTSKGLAFLTAAGIPLQGVIGGITVLTQLNPYVVALHLLLSIALIVLLTRLVMRTRGYVTTAVEPRLVWLARATFAVMMIAIWVGTVVTGSGPHSGDGGARRTGLDIETVAKLHSASVWASIALTIACIILFGRAGHRRARRLAMGVLHASLLQGAIGYAQYFLGLPLGLVIAHMVGLAIVTVCVSALCFGVARTERLA